MISTTFPQFHWQKVGTDLRNPLVINYWSRYIEVAKLSSETSEDVIARMKSIFARHGIPQEVRFYNRPQFSSDSFKYTACSPRYPTSNGKAERAIGIFEEVWWPLPGNLTYRSTSLQRSTLPHLPSNLEPSIFNYSQLQIHIRSQQKVNYDSCHCSRNSVKPLSGDDVCIEDGCMSTEGQIMQEAAPKSCQVNTLLWWNRKHDITKSDQELEQVVPVSKIAVTT